MNVSPGDGGTIEIGNIAVSTYPATYDFADGEQANIKAVAAPGYRFRGWSGALSHSDNPACMVMDCNKSLTANFMPVTHTLTMSYTGSGSVSPGVGAHLYREGMTVNLSAVAGGGWDFDGWTGDVVSPSSAITTVTVDGDKTVTARFLPRTAATVNWPLVSVITAVVAIGVFFFLLLRRGAP